MHLTIFTPTYNRVSELPGLYKSIMESLARMPLNSEHKVDWLIVDDGSDLDVKKCIDTFQGIPKLDIGLIRKENGGKHTAFNFAIENADGNIFVCIDDDDRLTPNAIKDIFSLAEKYANKGYGGFVGRVVDEGKEFLGKTIFDDILISNTVEIRDKYHFWGEPEVFFTSILKKYHFDVFPGERFLTEAYIFDQMSNDYPFVYTNTPLMIKKYLTGGLTDSQLKIRMQCPIGCEAYYYKRKQLCKGFKNKLKAEINRQRFGRYAKGTPQRKTDIYKILAVPFSLVLSAKDRIDCPNIV